MNRDDRRIKSILSYVLENCIFAFDELCRINKDLVRGMKPDSNADVNYLGAMNRMVQDYLIIRVGSLFDGSKGVVSFDKLFISNEDYKKMKEDKVIQYIIDQRNNFVAHTNRNHIENNFPITSKICSSRLKEILQRLRMLLLAN